MNKYLIRLCTGVILCCSVAISAQAQVITECVLTHLSVDKSEFGALKIIDEKGLFVLPDSTSPLELSCSAQTVCYGKEDGVGWLFDLAGSSEASVYAIYDFRAPVRLYFSKEC